MKELEEDVDYSITNNRIHILYKAMDLLGFKKDKIQNGKDRKVRSSRHDIEHILYASNADYFFTADKNMYYRAINIFRILKKRTIVTETKCIEDIFSVLKNRVVV